MIRRRSFDRRQTLGRRIVRDRRRGSTLEAWGCELAVGDVTDAASLRAAEPRRISPGCAACWRRAARLTASPVAKVESLSSMTISPDSTPMRTESCSSSTFGTISSAARTARSASSSCAIGTPKAAITASPANFSTVPPYASMHPATTSK